MTELIDGTGVIIKTSSNSSVVSVTINGSSKLFIFNKSLFYTFGVRCEGNMMNILEDGMEVELCYKLSRPEGKYRILAVWVGEKPDTMMKDDKSTAIYDANGYVISSVDNDNFLIQDDDFNTVCVTKDVVFRDGSLLPDNGDLAIDEEINFDAITVESEHPSRPMYHATCAWIGPRPIMVDRFDLRSPDYDTEFPDGIVEGTVAVIPNDVVAIVDVVLESVLLKVLLFRRSFRIVCTQLRDVVEVGDIVCMRLGFKSIFRGRKWWYALNAFKSSEEISPDIDHFDLDSDMNLCEDISRKVATVNVGSWEKTKRSDSSAINERLPGEKIGVTELDVLKATNENSSGIHSEVLPTINPFVQKFLSQGRGFLLNCLGTIIVEAIQGDDVVKIKHTLGTSSLMVRLKSSLRDSPSFQKLLKLHITKVRFHADFDMSPTGNWNFSSLRVWDERMSGFDIEVDLVSSVMCSDREVPSTNIGKIKSMLFPDSAIAIFDDVPVLVTLESLVSFEEINLKTSTIDTYLSVGDEIFAKIVKRSYEGKFYFKAIECYVGENFPPVLKADTKIKVNDPQSKTSGDVWVVGDLYRKEPIVYENGKFLVKFVSVTRPGVVCYLDLLKRGCVFVDGSLADVEMLKAFVGQEITFHVAHKRSDDLKETSKAIFVVACAWVGEEPLPKKILKEVLTVPKGLISCPWRYEAVVSSFPLPSHALCYIGNVPVLVLIREKDKGCKIADLKIGDRLVVTAHEEMIDEVAVVLSNDLQNLKRARDVEGKDVYRNFTGTVVSLPEPVGKIRVANSGCEVSFELCHMRRFKRTDLTNKQWIANVRNMITIGKQVYVSAVKNNAKNVPYRAFEVYFDE